jgi:hypothetical protein
MDYEAHVHDGQGDRVYLPCSEVSQVSGRQGYSPPLGSRIHHSLGKDALGRLHRDLKKEKALNAARYCDNKRLKSNKHPESKA